MKNIYFLILLIGFHIPSSLFSQVPQGINYQTIIRTNTGIILQNSPVSVKLYIHMGSASGTVEYSELHTATTNSYGLLNLIIGSGNPLSGSFAAVAWSAGNKWLEITADVNGTGFFANFGTTELLSVPFAFYAQNTSSSALPGPAGATGPTGQNGITGPTGANWNINSLETNAQGYLQINTSIPSSTNSTNKVWNVGGNTSIGSSEYIGTNDGNDFVIKTNNQDALRVTSGGAILATGDVSTGITPTSGAGTRMMWIPAKAAFRAGAVGGLGSNYWDDSNIGFGSFASGLSILCSGNFSIGAGTSNIVTGAGGIALGAYNISSADYSIAIGHGTIASGYHSVAMGESTKATNENTFAIGHFAFATGKRSMAFGYNTSTNNHTGAIIFSLDSSSTSLYFESTADNQFSVRASGGYIFYSDIAMLSGVSLAPGSGAWASLSDKRSKENFKKENPEQVLEKLSRIPVSTWNYKTQSKSIRHMGPMAQDFYDAFQLGESDTTITTIDIDGINMIAIQGLLEKIKKLENENAQLKSKMNNFQSQLDKLSGSKYVSNTISKK